MVILFMQHFFLPRQIAIKDFDESGSIQRAPQSITQIGEKEFGIIRRMGGIDERFVVH